MGNHIIPVESHRVDNSEGLGQSMNEKAGSNPDFFQRLARVGVLPNGQFVLETVRQPITVSDKEGQGLTQLAEPTEKNAIYALTAQKQGSTRVLIVEDGDGSAEFARRVGQNNLAQIVYALMDPFPRASGKIALAPGSTLTTRTYMGNVRTLVDMASHKITNVVAVPTNLGGGYVARSTENGRHNGLWYLTANKARDGHFSANSWQQVATFDRQVVGIGLRFYGTTLIVTVEGQGFVAVEASNIASQITRQIVKSAAADGFRALGPIANPNGPSQIGLFTQAGKGRDQVPQTYRPHTIKWH